MDYFRSLGRLCVVLIFSTSVGLSTAYAMAVSSAGKIIAADGIVHALNIENDKRPIKRGDDFYLQDTILTEAKSTVSLRFTDGTLLELKESSNFKIKDYHFQQDTPKDDSYSAELLKGGFRTITGALGKRNPDHYEVQARTTTLTIRGTELVMNIVPAASEVGGIAGDLNVQVGLLEGAAVVKSGSQMIDLSPNTHAVVNSNGYIVRGMGIPANIMNGYSSNNIKTLIQQATKAGYTPAGAAAGSTPDEGGTKTFIEGEGATKPPAPKGSSTPCEGISGMSGAMP